MDRRQFLIGASAVGVLAACGGGSSGPTEELFAARFFFPEAVVANGMPQRMAWGIADTQAPLRAPDVPPFVVVQLFRDGAPHTDRFDVFRRGEGLVVPYFPIEVAFDEPGLYDIRLSWDDKRVDSVVQAFEPGVFTVPGPGDPLPPIETPTVDDARGVNPICTRLTDPCPFHDRTLAEALTEGRPTVLVVSTPAFCQTAVCGPILEFMIDEHEARGDAFGVVHAEVYVDPNDNIEDITETMVTLGMLYEPAIFLADANGTVVERLDNTVDQSELTEALDRLMS